MRNHLWQVAGGLTCLSLAASVLLPTGAAFSASPEQVAIRPSAVAVGGASDESPYIAAWISDIGKDKSIVASFIVPTLECGSEDVALYTAVELARDDLDTYADGGVVTFCQDGALIEYPAFLQSGAPPERLDKPATGGDLITVKNTFSKGAIKIKIFNETAGWHAQTSITDFTPNLADVQVSALILDGGVAPVPDFGSLPVRDVVVGGMPLGQTSPSKLRMVDEDGNPVVVPGKIKHGDDFNFKYVA